MLSFDAYEIPSALDGIPSTLFVPEFNIDPRYAFSSRSRNILHHRAGGACEMTGVKGMPLECAHINHARSSHYNDPENGIVVTPLAHLAQHLYFRDDSEEWLGLPEYQNDWSIDQLVGRVLKVNYELGVKEDPLQLAKQLFPRVARLYEKKGLF